MPKACSTCREVKPLDAFYGDSRSSDGKKSRCADCENAARRELRESLRKDLYDMDAISSCGYRSDNSSADADSIGNSGPEIQAYGMW